MTPKELFVKELLENLPEYAISFDCERWDYERCTFRLRDLESTGAAYTLTLDMAVKGFDKLCAEIESGKLHFEGLLADYKVDGGQWDSLAVDALLQMSVLGEVIYG